MKIGPLDNQPLAATANGDRKATSASADKAAGTAEASAQVDISSTGSLLAQTSADPTFDAEKVARIAAAIREGKFNVDAEKIADKLISNAQDLLKHYSQN